MSLKKKNIITPAHPHLLLKFHSPVVSRALIIEPKSILKEVEHERTVETVLVAASFHLAIHNTAVRCTVSSHAAVFRNSTTDVPPTIIFLDGGIAWSEVASSVVKCRESLREKISCSTVFCMIHYSLISEWNKEGREGEREREERITHCKTPINWWYGKVISRTVAFWPALTEVEYLSDVGLTLLSIPCPFKVDIILSC